jgi:EAL domain-containing protein (putative c-di-GMP-specific phosphodiesterase class I)
MYAAKSDGKKRFANYRPSMHAKVQRRHEFALELERAVERREIAVSFQPIVSLRTGDVLAFEALARWYHPDRGHVPPSEFIPVAEEVGLMGAIGQSVLREACQAACEWQAVDPGRSPIGVTVNLSPSQLLSDRLVDDVARTLLESRIDTSSLTLEVTESAAMREIDFVAERLAELRALGVKLSLDDFGTGHSSLERLDKLPLNALKIAKPFVDRLLDGSSDTSFVDAFVRLAYSLGMECIAEGIEHQIQVPRLLDRGCGLGQGFYFARPMSRAELRDYVRGLPLSRTDA